MKKRNIILIIIAVILVWFFIFRTKELSVTYDSVEIATNNVAYGRTTSMKSMARNEAVPELALANMVTDTALYDESDIETGGGAVGNEERYRENRYYRVDTISFEELVKELEKDIKNLNGVIKSNNQNSNKKVVYDKEFYPRLETLEFTISNTEENIEIIEKTLKKWGDIRVADTNKTSIEQELTNYEQQLKELEEARKALKDSKDKDWIARQDADLAKRSEQIKNQIENAKAQSTYKTYNVSIYEVIKFRVNALRYWYSNNYSLKNAVDEVLPAMIGLFAILIPISIAVIILILLLVGIYRKNRKEDFREKISIIKEEFGDDNIHFDIKM